MALVPASDQPLYVILLIDYSESMIEEMPVVKAAAKQFAQRLLRPSDRIAVVGFGVVLTLARDAVNAGLTDHTGEHGPRRRLDEAALLRQPLVQRLRAAEQTHVYYPCGSIKP